MEGGCGGNAPDRRADRLVHDFDLNVKLESDEELEQEPEQEQLAHNVAPQAIHGLEEGSPGVDLISDNSKVEKQNQMVPRVRILGYGGINVPRRVSKRVMLKQRRSANAKKRSDTLKIRRKSLDKEGHTEIQPPSPVEERKP